MFSRSFNAFVARIVLPFMLFASFSALSRFKATEKNEAVVEEVKPDISIELYEEDEVPIHTARQRRALEFAYNGTALKEKGYDEWSKPEKLELTWTLVAEEGVEIDQYVIKVGTKEDLSDARVFTSDKDSVKVDNFFLDTRYYWNVSCEYKGFTFESATSTFVTSAEAPRFMNVEGVTNVRDIGGWSTLDGKVTRQGLVYRTARLHSDDEVVITENGKKTMTELMGIKTEIDIRNEVSDRPHSVIGENVKYVHLSTSYIFFDKKDGKETVYNFFKTLADEDNYPLLFHCYIGTDRTGACAFMLLALLGVDPADIKADYLMSNLAKIGGGRDGECIGEYIEQLSHYDGDTLAERAASYLLEVGLTADEIAFIRNYLTETK